MTEESIEEALDKEVAELEIILGEKFRKECEWDEKCLPLVTSSEPYQTKMQSLTQRKQKPKKKHTGQMKKK